MTNIEANESKIREIFEVSLKRRILEEKSSFLRKKRRQEKDAEKRETLNKEIQRADAEALTQKEIEDDLLLMLANKNDISAQFVIRSI